MLLSRYQRSSEFISSEQWGVPEWDWPQTDADNNMGQSSLQNLGRQHGKTDICQKQIKAGVGKEIIAESIILIKGTTKTT